VVSIETLFLHQPIITKIPAMNNPIPIIQPQITASGYLKGNSVTESLNTINDVANKITARAIGCFLEKYDSLSDKEFCLLLGLLLLERNLLYLFLLDILRMINYRIK